MGKVKQLNQDIIDDLEMRSLSIGERMMYLTSAIINIEILIKPQHKYNKTELLILNGILKQLRSLRDTDRQTQDHIDEELSRLKTVGIKDL